MFRLNKIQRLAVSIFIPILSVPIYGELILWIYKPEYLAYGRHVIPEPILPWDYALFDYPAAIITFMIFILVFELYLWRTIQPREDISFSRLKNQWSKLATIKRIGLLCIHIIVSVSIPLMLFSISAFQIRYDMEKTSILIFCCYWVLVVANRTLRWASSKSSPSTSDNTELKDNLNDNIQSNIILPNLSSLIDESEDKGFGEEIEKIENIKVTRRED